MWKTLLQLLGVTIILAVIFFILHTMNTHWTASKMPYLIAIYFFLTLLTTVVNQWAARQGSLVVVFIASQVLRIIFSLVILYLFMSWEPAEANALVGNFFIIYLFYLIFEIKTVLSNLRAEFRRSE